MSKGTALVTGAANGIGRAISLRLADDGYDVALNDLPNNRDKLDELKTEIKVKGRQAHIVVADVTQEEEVKGMVDEVVKEMNGLDIMIANAGIIILKPMSLLTLEEWERSFAVNVRGTFLCYKYAGQAMIASGKRGGRIIGASSIAGKQGRAISSAYCATKFAVRGLTQSAASEYGKHGITVNAYAPGAVETDMLVRMDEMYQDLTQQPPGTLSAMQAARTLVGRNGNVSDVANLVSFLASPEAHFITGQSISCNGGAFFD